MAFRTPRPHEWEKALTVFAPGETASFTSGRTLHATVVTNRLKVALPSPVPRRQPVSVPTSPGLFITRMGRRTTRYTPMTAPTSATSGHRRYIQLRIVTKMRCQRHYLLALWHDAPGGKASSVAFVGNGIVLRRGTCGITLDSERLPCRPIGTPLAKENGYRGRGLNRMGS